jgi:hypothetical protein
MLFIEPTESIRLNLLIIAQIFLDTIRDRKIAINKQKKDLYSISKSINLKQFYSLLTQIWENPIVKQIYLERHTKYLPLYRGTE